MSMLFLISAFCLVASIILLCVLSAIDIKERILPNELVLGLAVCGAVFHPSLSFHYLQLEQMVLGAFIGGGLLYVIRGFANYYYGEDSLGLGDVKLLAAGGIWLGPEAILIAMTIGALAGLLHGSAIAYYMMYKTKIKLDIGKMAVPAGPGFAVGLLLAAIYQFRSLPEVLWQ